MRRRFEGATAASASDRLFIKCRNTHFGPFLECLGAMTNPTALKFFFKPISNRSSQSNPMVTHLTSSRYNFPQGN